MEKESDESSDDYSFISKYIRDDAGSEKANSFKQKFEIKKSGPTEVFGSIGEGECRDYGGGGGGFNRFGNNSSDGNSSGNNRFKKSFNSNEEDEDLEVNIPPEEEDPKTRTSSKLLTQARQEFIKEMEDQSLSLDTATQANHDWK